MAALHPDCRMLWLGFALCTGLNGPLSAAASLSVAADGADTIVFDSGNASVDPDANTLRLGKGIWIHRGDDLSIKAREATAHSLEKSRQDNVWDLISEVQILFEGTELIADKATVQFANKRLSLAKVVGVPATFAHHPKDSAQHYKGRANSIEFDDAKSTVRFAGNAWFSDGRYEISTEAVVYNVKTHVFESEAGPDDKHRVTTLIPGAKKPSPADPAASK
jgi:lipopolysaccharide transport protein LptA